MCAVDRLYDFVSHDNRQWSDGWSTNWILRVCAFGPNYAGLAMSRRGTLGARTSLLLCILVYVHNALRATYDLFRPDQIRAEPLISEVVLDVTPIFGPPVQHFPD
jgi:hypothetical protein